ncbi:hypothetical protein BC828DRAFT_226698 [Blastocladiella britannica]|nr:hypothetical protein BC828DRAFT_226698 [Blastocladiella britannica]
MSLDGPPPPKRRRTTRNRVRPADATIEIDTVPTATIETDPSELARKVALHRAKQLRSAQLAALDAEERFVTAMSLAIDREQARVMAALRVHMQQWSRTTEPLARLWSTPGGKALLAMAPAPSSDAVAVRTEPMYLPPQTSSSSLLLPDLGGGFTGGDFSQPFPLGNGLPPLPDDFASLMQLGAGTDTGGGMGGDFDAWPGNLFDPLFSVPSTQLDMPTAASPRPG